MKKKIGQYEIGDLLGEGGIGQVHAAFDTVLQREVAMKSLRPELLSDTNFVDRFRAEATSLARLNHPNITTIYSLIPDGKNLFMVMERVRGHTLDDILKKRNAPIEVRESLAIISQAADGLGYAHSMGVIHRDIKPSNLMIAENGVLKIMDFGIARIRGSQRLTRTGSIVGTLAYMAPEQLRGEEGEEACDLYSLAIVLYEMLSGQPPFSAASEYDLMQAQINQKPERLIPRVPGLEPRVEAALLRALSKKPAQRFPSTRAFSDALGASALRLDAPKILHNDTRLLDAGAMPLQIAPAGRSLLDRLSAALPWDVKSWKIFSPEMRAVAIGGGGALVVALGLIAIMAFHWSSGPPKPSTAKLDIDTSPKNLPPDTTSGGPSLSGSSGSGATSGSLAEIRVEADRGDASAQNALGMKYAKGEDGLRRDETKAVEWYRKAAAQGYAGAETNLGDMYFSGRGGLDQSYLQALSWYLKAAEQKSPDAEFRLGYMYEKGFGTPSDMQRALTFYRSAADGGNAAAENVLGALYATGSDGLEQDYKQAVDWYRKAADQGFAKAEKNLGDMYYLGHGVDQSYEQAVVWYTKAADQQFTEALVRLGSMYEKGYGVPEDDQKAIELYQRAAGNGSVEAQRGLDRLRAKLTGTPASSQ